MRRAENSREHKKLSKADDRLNKQEGDEPTESLMTQIHGLRFVMVAGEQALIAQIVLVIN